MKNTILMMSVFITLVFISCTVGNSSSEELITGSKNDYRIEITPSYIEKFVEPGQILSFTVEKFLEGRGASREKKTVDNFDVHISDDDLAVVNEDKTIKINEDALSGSRLIVKIVYDNFSQENSYTIRKSLKTTVDENGVIIDPSVYDVMVNKYRLLPKDYVPDDLVELKVPTLTVSSEINQLREKAADALTELFEGAEKQGFNLIARSGYRSYATQNILYDRNVAAKGIEHAEKYSAQAGKSEHQTGLSIDITSKTVDYKLSDNFGETPEGIWISENAHKYGFIIRYPKGKEQFVEYGYEPWHLRYVGVQFANILYESGLTMEEYFEQ